MLKVTKTTPKEFGEEILLGQSFREVSDDVMNNGTVYCVKHCFAPEPIDGLRERIFDYFSKIPQKQKNYGGTPLNANYHTIEHGISPIQKTMHYLHAYVFDKMDEIPPTLNPQIQQLFYSLTNLYNNLTNCSRPLVGHHEDGKRFHSQIFQYPIGGGMFGTHTHPLEPLRLSLILGFSKRGRDFQEGAAGFEAPDGTIIDTSAIHDIGDILIFRVNLKHWVTPCDITSPLDESKSNGRWSAVLGVY